VTYIEKVNKLRDGGYTEDEISQWADRERSKLEAAGYSTVDINDYFGIKELNETPIKKHTKDIVTAVQDEPETEDDKKLTKGEALAASRITHPRVDVSDMLQDAFSIGYGSSITGLILNEGLPEEALEDPNILENVASAFGTLAGDVPFMIPFAQMGATATLPLAAASGPAAPVVEAAGTMAAAFGLTAALRESIILAYKRGEIVDAKDFIERFVLSTYEGLKGALTGATTGFAGGVQSKLLPKLASEIVTMTSIGSALEGQVPTLQAFIETAIVIGGFKATTSALGLRSTYKTQPKETRELVDILGEVWMKTRKTPDAVWRDMREDPTIKQDILAGRIPRAYDYLIKPKLTPEPKPEKLVTVEPEFPPTKGVSTLEAAQSRTNEIMASLPDAKSRLTLSEIYTQSVNRLHPIFEFVKKATTGELIPAELNPAESARTSVAAHAKAQLFLDYEVRSYKTGEVVGLSFKEIMSPIAKDAVKFQEFKNFAVAMREIELHARAEKKGVVRESRMSIEDANLIVNGTKHKYGEIFEQTVQFQNNVLAYLRDSGVITADAFTAMTQANKAYVPFYRIFEEGIAKQTGKQPSNPIRGIKEEGSLRDLVDPIDSIVKNTYLYVQLAATNKIRVLMANLAESKGLAGHNGIMKRVKPKVKPVKVSGKELDRFFEEFELEQGVDFTAESLTIFRPNAMTPSDNQIVLFRNGKREIWEVEPDVARALNGLDTAGIGLLERLVALPAKTLRAGAVLDFEFPAKNFTRDVLTNMIQSKSAFTPWNSIRGLMHLVKKDKLFRDWLYSGGAQASIVSLDRRYLQENLQRMQEVDTLTRRGINVIKNPLGLLQAITSTLENVNRLGAFEAEIGLRSTAGAQGKRVLAEAARASREGSIDFQRIGPKMRAANMLIAFFNAGVQGTDKFVRSHKENPAKTMAASTALVTMPTILLYFANLDDERIQNKEQWEKDAFWFIGTPERVYRIPKPFLYGLVYGTFTERMLDAFIKDNPTDLEELKRLVLEGTLPPLIPNVAIPIIESALGKSLRTLNPIVPHRLEAGVNAYEYQSYTTEISKRLAQLTSRIPGTPLPDSPIVLENYVRQWTGGLGIDVLRLADKALRASGVLPDPQGRLPTDPLTDIPIIQAFISKTPSFGSGPTSEFYERYGKKKEIQTTFRRLIEEEGNVGEAGKLLALDFVAMIDLDNINTTLSQQAKYIRIINLNDGLSPEEKQQLIDETYQYRVQIAQMGNDIMNDIEAAIPPEAPVDVAPKAPRISRGAAIKAAQDKRRSAVVPDSEPAFTEDGLRDDPSPLQPLPAPKTTTAIHAEIWAIAYQTDNSITKKASFVRHVKGFSGDPEIENEIRNTVIKVFQGDEGTDINKLTNIMVDIAVHESNGFKDLVQKGGGPARGIMQVEPKTAFSLIKHSTLLGEKAKEILLTRGMDIENKISPAKMKKFLLDNVISTIFGTAQLLSGAKTHGLLGDIT
jgi:hypothetical protein